MKLWGKILSSSELIFLYGIINHGYYQLIYNIFKNKSMFLMNGGGHANMQIKGKRKHGGNQHNQQGQWGQHQQQQQGGWGQQQQGGNWGQQQGQYGQQGQWGQQQQQGQWGQQQNQGGWNHQQQNQWGGQGQQGNNYGQQGGQGGWNQQGGQGGQGNWGQEGLGFINNQNAWGNNLHGGEWIQEQKKRNQFDIFSPGQQQNIQLNDIIEPSAAKQRLKQLQQSGQKFEDDKFPPNETSLTGQYGAQENWSQIQWKRASQFMDNPQIFSGKIEPGDIKQGYLGDCYFLAGLAALAERPDRIFNLFLLQQNNNAKYYSVKLLYKGKWRTIDLDQYIPTMYNKPAFSKSIGEELWVILLEKAWAKLYTNFKRIAAGYAEEAIHDLTGAPIKQLYFQHSSFDYQRDWEYLVKASHKEYSMVGSTQPGSDTNKSFSGVVQGHAYTILNATTIHADGQEHRIVQCRNPWGKGQSHGAWSDEDQNWNSVSEQEKQRVGYNPNKEDGIFFIGYDDFIKEFRALTIAEIDDDASYIYKSHTDPERQGVYFKVEIYQSGKYSFLMDKTPQRIYPDKIQDKFRYPNSLVQVGRLDGNSVDKRQAFQTKKRTLCHQQNLDPGVYIVYARIDYDTDFEDKFDVNLAVYSSTACNITLASQQEAITFSGDPDVKWVGEEQEGEIIQFGNQGNNQGNNNGGWNNEDGGYNNQWGNNGGNNNQWGNNGGNNNQWGNNGGNGGNNDGGWGGNGGNNDGW